MHSALLPRVVHSLFKEYHSCARSFSLLLLPAPLSLCRPARRKRLKTPLLPLRKPPLTPPPTLLLPPPTLLPPPPTLLLPLRALPPMLLLPLRALPTLLLLLLRTLPRRCNLRRTAKNWGAKGNLRAPFLLSGALGTAQRLDTFNRSINPSAKSGRSRLERSPRT